MSQNPVCLDQRAILIPQNSLGRSQREEEAGRAAERLNIPIKSSWCVRSKDLDELSFASSPTEHWSKRGRFHVWQGMPFAHATQ